MNKLIILLLTFFVTSCASGQYYVLDNSPNHSSVTVYKDESIWVSLLGMNGKSTQLMFASKKDTGEVEINVEKVTLTASVDGVVLRPVSTSFKEGTFNIEKGRMHIMVADYGFNEFPEQISINLVLKGNHLDKPIAVNQEVNLSIVRYGFWGALMSI